MRKFLRGFKFAAHGVASVLKNEINFRFHTVMAIYVLFFAYIGKVSTAEFATLCGLIGQVLSLELVNSAIETLCDKITTEQDKLIGKAKDISAGAVLISAIFAAVAGLFIFLQEKVLDTVFVSLLGEGRLLTGRSVLVQQTLSNSLVDLLLGSADSLGGVLTGGDGSVGLLDLGLQSRAVGLIAGRLNGNDLHTLFSGFDVGHSCTSYPIIVITHLIS